MTPKVKILKTSFRIHRRDTELRFVAKFGENRPLRSCRKQASIFIRPINEHTYNIDDTVVKHKGRLPEKPERSSGLGLSHKKLGLRGTRLSPHFGQNGAITPKIR